ncbi:MAG: radical SAM protein [Pseudomonadota bacterium]
MSKDRITYRSPSYFEVANPRGSSWRDFRDESYREYRKQWDARPAERNPADFPLHLDVDVTNVCNLRCRMCPRTHFLETGNKKWAPDGQLGFMDLDLFKKVVDQGAENGAYSIKINFLGEPLLHPGIVEQVEYAKKRGLEVMMNTNAVLLTREMSRRLLQAGLDDIFFSVDSPYPEAYESIRVGAVFNQVIDHIKGFVELADRLGLRNVQTRASMVEDVIGGDPQTRADFKKLFYGLGVAETGFGLMTDMKTDYWAKYGRIEGFVCRDPYNRMFVFWDGLVGPCCGEWERGLIMGDANTEPLRDIWRNDKYRMLRAAHEHGRYETIPICRNCSVPWLSRVEVQG